MGRHKSVVKTILLSALCGILMLSACSSSDVTETTTAAATTETVTETPTPAPETTAEVTTAAETETTPSWETPVNFTWDPYVYSDLMAEVYGEDSREDFRNLIDAIENRKDSFTYSSQDFIDNWAINVNSTFPPFFYLCEFTASEGTAQITYYLSEEEQAEFLENFGSQVECIVKDSGIMESDTPLQASALLYHYLSWIFTYDEEAANSGDTDVSAYLAIMNFSGICQSFAGSYAYIATQLGIPCTDCGGLSDSGAHEWTAMLVDGELYHSDVTFENGWGGGGMHFFLMSTASREEDGFPVENYNIGNMLMGNEVVADSERFSDFRNLYEVDEIVRDGNVLRITGYDWDGNQVEVTVE